MKYLYIYVNAKCQCQCRFRFLITDVFIYIFLQLIFYKSDSKRFTSENSFIPFVEIDFARSLVQNSRINKKKCGVLVVETIYLYFLDTCRKTATVSCKRLGTSPYVAARYISKIRMVCNYTCIAWKTVCRTIVTSLAE